MQVVHLVQVGHMVVSLGGTVQRVEPANHKCGGQVFKDVFRCGLNKPIINHVSPARQ